MFIKRSTFGRPISRVFEKGEYVALDGHGSRSGNLCAFERRTEAASIIIAVPRLLSHITDPASLPLGKAVWEDTILIIPDSEPGSEYRNVFTGQVTASAFYGRGKIGVLLSDVFSHFPVALLERVERQFSPSNTAR